MKQNIYNLTILVIYDKDSGEIYCAIQQMINNVLNLYGNQDNI